MINQIQTAILIKMGMHRTHIKITKGKMWMKKWMEQTIIKGNITLLPNITCNYSNCLLRRASTKVSLTNTMHIPPANINLQMGNALSENAIVVNKSK